MAAGLGFKDFTTGEVLTAADVDGYLMQGVWVFASATARDAAVTSPQEGNFAYLKDTNVTTYYTGSAWANLDTTGMTNPMTTTGDTIYSSSGSTPARLGIGSTGQVLTVVGGVPSWAAPAGGSSFAGCNLNKTGGSQSISSSTWTKVTFNNELFDTDAFHDNSTNNTRITIPSGKAGYYEVTGSIGWGAGGSVNAIGIYLNNSRDFQGSTQVASSGRLYQTISTIINLSVGDYVELAGFHDGGGSVDIWDTTASTNSTTFAVQFLGA